MKRSTAPTLFRSRAWQHGFPALVVLDAARHAERAVPPEHDKRGKTVLPRTLRIRNAVAERMLAREERHDPLPRHIGAEVRDEVSEVVFLRATHGAVGQEHVRAALRESADGVVGVDPGVHPLRTCQFRKRRTQFRSNHSAGAEQRIEKRWRGGRREHQLFSLASRFQTTAVARLRRL